MLVIDTKFSEERGCVRAMLWFAQQGDHNYNFAAMESQPVNVIQLQRRDPAAWTALLAEMPVANGLVVTAVNSEPVWNNFLVRPGRMVSDPSRRVRRYQLTLAGHSDPITFITKRTNLTEAAVYRLAGSRLGPVMPPCHYLHFGTDHSWLVLDDVPNDVTPERWLPGHVDNIIQTLAQLHLSTWQDKDNPSGMSLCDAEYEIRHFLDGEDMPYTWSELRQSHAALFEQGPAAVLSEHAIQNAGRLAPALLEAANGLVVMRDLGGWPGVLGESHLAAAADLLDDPVPILNALSRLPDSLLHGTPHPYHWRVTIFDEQYLIDWSEAKIGPGILDLIGFIEHYPLIYSRDASEESRKHTTSDAGEFLIRLRELTPLVEETLIDTYFLAMSSELGSRFPSRAARAAIPAARCLHVLTTWFAYFGSWFADMPDPYVWQRVNRMSEAELMGSNLGPMAGIRPYLAGVFERFLRAYRTL